MEVSFIHVCICYITLALSDWCVHLSQGYYDHVHYVTDP